MQELEKIIDNIYEWVKVFTTFETVPANEITGEKHEEFVTIDFAGVIEDMGTIKDENITKSDDDTFHYNTINKYKQKIELEFYGEGSNFEALKVQQSISISSTIPFLKNIAVQDNGITNTTVPLANGYEKRHLLSLFIYFSLTSKTPNLEIIESIEYSKNIKGVVYE